MMEYNIAKGKAIGTSHIKRGVICQDDCKVDKKASGYILAVADGHGSEKCKYSDIGSEKAVNAFHEIISIIMKAATSEEMESSIKVQKDDKIPRAIREEWLKKIYAFHQKYHKNEAFEPILYGTTLIGLAIFPTFAFALQIGDGNILCAFDSNPQKRIEPFLDTEKTLGNDTDSLCNSNYLDKVMTKLVYYHETSDWPTLFLLSTDGLANSFVSEEDYHKCAQDYIDVARAHGFSAIKSNLIGWLKETTSNGCGDDIAVAIAIQANLQDNLAEQIDDMQGKL